MSAKIKKGDLVEIIAGKEATSGNPQERRGRVIRVQPEKNRVWVEKLNIVKRHQKRVEGKAESGIVEKEAPLDLSNVMLVDPETDKPTRVGFKLVHEISEEERKAAEAKGKQVRPRKVRYAKRSGHIFDT